MYSKCLTVFVHSDCSSYIMLTRRSKVEGEFEAYKLAVLPIDFLELQDMHELVKVFDEMQNFLPSKVIVENRGRWLSIPGVRVSLLNLECVRDTKYLNFRKNQNSLISCFLVCRNEMGRIFDNMRKTKECYLRSLDEP